MALAAISSISSSKTLSIVRCRPCYELTIVHKDKDRDIGGALWPYLDNDSIHTIDDVITLSDDSFVLVKKNGPQYKEDNELVHGLDVSIPIAAAVTSGAEFICLYLKIIQILHFIIPILIQLLLIKSWIPN